MIKAEEGLTLRWNTDMPYLDVSRPKVKRAIVAAT